MSNLSGFITGIFIISLILTLLEIRKAKFVSNDPKIFEKVFQEKIRNQM